MSKFTMALEWNVTYGTGDYGYEGSLIRALNDLGDALNLQAMKMRDEDSVDTAIIHALECVAKLSWQERDRQQDAYRASKEV